jgi:hypothetical protein
MSPHDRRRLSGWNWDFLFLFAFLIGLYSIHRLTRVQEAGEVEERIVVHELISEIRSEIRNLSTANGLREMVMFPFAVVQTSLRDIGKKR